MHEDDLLAYVAFLERELDEAREALYALGSMGIEGPWCDEVRRAAAFLGEDPDRWDPAINPHPDPT